MSNKHQQQPADSSQCLKQLCATLATLGVDNETEIENHGTRLVHKEQFSGIAISFASLDAIEKGYIQMNQAFKHKAENQGI